jgi:hypothetical protein
MKKRVALATLFHLGRQVQGFQPRPAPSLRDITEVLRIEGLPRRGSRTDEQTTINKHESSAFVAVDAPPAGAICQLTGE